MRSILEERRFALARQYDMQPTQAGIRGLGAPAQGDRNERLTTRRIDRGELPIRLVERLAGEKDLGDERPHDSRPKHQDPEERRANPGRVDAGRPRSRLASIE